MNVLRIGLVSDTHGLLRPQALAALQGCAHIVHAGDICDAGILAALARIAPVTAVRGNNDHGAWAERIPATARVAFDGVEVFALHELPLLRIDPRAQGIRVVVSGHSHRPLISAHDDVLYVNPGSCGPRRFSLPVSVGELLIEGGSVRARLIELTV